MPFKLGSPPRMRGKAGFKLHSAELAGITPAYAGKRRGWSKWQISSRGSPPRMRGKERSCHSHQCVHGITPAYAGKSAKTHWTITTRRDHPRVCGEKQSRQRCRMSRTGSPPRMRGKEMEDVPARQRGGITPACAGKRHQAGNPHHAAEDHPRVCGEKSGFCQRSILHLGSPPRMRGKADPGEQR